MAPTRDEPARAERRAIRVRGAVQGVGFRPFVYRVAHELGLSGWVRNDAAGVLVEARGSAAALAEFERRLAADAPPLARVDGVASQRLARADEPAAAGFAIVASDGAAGAAVTTSVPPDTATCGDCLRELFDPRDRRWRHPFINCTQCGPRYTLTRALPYDRAQTSMAAFALCPECRREYEDPADRRFHAEPNACPRCGPTLSLVDPLGRPLRHDAATKAALPADAIAATLALLRAGRIVAVKGLGGFHLVCDATHAAAVARLRSRKHRDEKPFAVMAANAASARLWADVDEAAAALLASPERPAVLLPMRPGTAARLAGVAPGLDHLGLMLPCTPIQHLLFHEAAGRPPLASMREGAQPLLLVMTSANPGGEPLVTGNGEALERLADIADALLLHDRDIVARCDDGVVRPAPVAGGAPQFVRRARGHTPRPIKLARPGPPVLATGAWLKNTVCVTRGDEAFLSPHVGDLDNAASCNALVDAVRHLCRILDVRPQAVAHDLHPDFFSSRHAAALAAEHALPAFAVQHHHAHVAAVAAEHRHDGPLLGLALDGVGLGDDGSAWGGELLRVDGARCRRIGHLAPIAMPGGDAAAREPWRMAAAVLARIGRGADIERRYAGRHAAAPAVAALLSRGLRCPPTTSMGRWFDAAAGLLGVRGVAAYEGQAPMLLEALARRAGGDAGPGIAGLVALSADGVLDPTPLLARLADERDPAQGAALFHRELADGLARWAAQAAAATGLGTVALGGGCFLNARLLQLLLPRLQALGLQALTARQAPCNDGGIALGQAWVALHRLQEEPQR